MIENPIPQTARTIPLPGIKPPVHGVVPVEGTLLGVV